MSSYGFQKIVVGDTPVGFDLSIVNPPGKSLTKPYAACFVVENNPIRVRSDGGIPTENEGVPLEVGQFVELKSEHDVENFKAISQNPLYTGVINVQFSTSIGE